MEITHKEKFKIYLDRYLDDQIDLNDLYELYKKLFNLNNNQSKEKNVIIKKNMLHKGYDLRDTYEESKRIQKNNDIKEAINQSIDFMNNNNKIVGFTFNNRTKRPWFHYKLLDSHTLSINNKYSNRCNWHDLYIKPLI